MSTTDHLKTIRIFPFSGKEEDWNCWSKTFLALAATRKYKDELELPANHTSDDDLNLQAYNDLLLSCQEEVVFGIIDEADGSAKDAWEGLKSKFEPRNGAMKVQLKWEFQQMKLDEDEDPDEFFTKIELLRRRLKNLKIDISDEDVMIHILNNTLKMYENTVEICEDELSANRLTMKNLKERFRTKYK